jgi:hypothetical protein
MVLPGHLLGDYRYASLAAVLLAAILMARARPSQQARLAAALFLTTPRIFFVLEQGWSEPVSILLLAATVSVMARSPNAAAVPAGLMVASKQYLVLAVPLLWRHAVEYTGSAKRFLAIAILVGAAVTLPFVASSPMAFVEDVILLQLREPFRADSLSYLPWLAAHGWGQPSVVWTLAAMLAALAIAMARGGASATAFAASLAFTTLAAFAFGRKAFCNYYFFVIGALCCGIAAADAEDDRT